MRPADGDGREDAIEQLAEKGAATYPAIWAQVMADRPNGPARPGEVPVPESIEEVTAWAGKVGMICIAEFCRDLCDCERGIFSQPLSGFLETIPANDRERWKPHITPGETLHCTNRYPQVRCNLIDADDGAVCRDEVLHLVGQHALGIRCRKAFGGPRCECCDSVLPAGCLIWVMHGGRHGRMQFGSVEDNRGVLDTVWICVQRGDSGRAERRTDCPPAAAEILMGYPGGRAVEPHAVTLNDQIRRRERQHCLPGCSPRWKLPTRHPEPADPRVDVFVCRCSVKGRELSRVEDASSVSELSHGTPRFNLVVNLQATVVVPHIRSKHERR